MNGPDRPGRRSILVTGGSQGLGMAAATRFAARGHRVLLTSRSGERARAAAEQVRARVSTTDPQNVVGEALDLSSPSSVRTFAAALRSRGEPLHVLVANAAIRPPPRRTLTGDGVEVVFATDHLGHFALAMDLLPLLHAAARDDGDARLVVVSSRLHRPGVVGPSVRLDLDDPNLSRGYRPMRAYKNAKLANLLFTYEFERRHGPNGVHANALCPGFVPATIADNASWLQRLAYRHVLTHLPFARPLDEAVDTYEYVALDPALRDVGGQFYAEKQPIRSSPDSYDPLLAQRLWVLSENRTAD